jgi:hypothetical protein
MKLPRVCTGGIARSLHDQVVGIVRHALTDGYIAFTRPKGWRPPNAYPWGVEILSEHYSDSL